MVVTADFNYLRIQIPLMQYFLATVLKVHRCTVLQIVRDFLAL